MKSFIVQIIVFSIAVGLFVLGGYIAIKGNTTKAAITAISCCFTAGVILVIVAAVNPYHIVELKYGKLSLKRYQYNKGERLTATELSNDISTYITVSPEAKEKFVKEAKYRVNVSTETKDKFVKEAKQRVDEMRSPEDYLILSTEAWRANKYDKALELVFDGLALKPEDTRVQASLLHRKGSIYESLKVYNMAVKHYEEAIRKDPLLPWPHNNLGGLYHDLGKYDEAEVEFKKAIILDPEDARIHHNLGFIYYARKKYDEAEAEYRVAIRLDPEYTTAHYNLGVLYSNQKKYKEAEVEYKKAIELDPGHVLSHSNLGHLYYSQKKYTEAEAEYKKAIELDPEHVLSHSNLGGL